MMTKLRWALRNWRLLLSFLVPVHFTTKYGEWHVDPKGPSQTKMRSYRTSWWQWRQRVWGLLTTESGFTVLGIVAGIALLIIAVVLFAGVNTWLGLLLVVLAILAIIFL